jgi:hypothetical protein
VIVAAVVKLVLAVATVTGYMKPSSSTVNRGISREVQAKHNLYRVGDAYMCVKQRKGRVTFTSSSHQSHTQHSQRIRMYYCICKLQVIRVH